MDLLEVEGGNAGLDASFGHGNVSVGGSAMRLVVGASRCDCGGCAGELKGSSGRTRANSDTQLHMMRCLEALDCDAKSR